MDIVTIADVDLIDEAELVKCQRNLRVIAALEHVDDPDRVAALPEYPAQGKRLVSEEYPSNMLRLESQCIEFNLFDHGCQSVRPGHRKVLA